MLSFKRSLKKKILATDGYVEEPLETRIHMADRLGSNVETKYICCVFLFTGDDVRSEERRNHYGIQNRH